MELRPITTCYEFEQISLYYIQDRFGRSWYDALRLAEVLQYGDPYKAINIHVSQDDRVSYEDIQMNTPIYGMQSETVFLNVFGVSSLIYASDKPVAQVYQAWVSMFLLPNLRKVYGDAQLKKMKNLRQLEARQLALENAHQIMEQTIRDVEPDISVKTNDSGLRHQLVILKRLDNNDQTPFYCIRSQKCIIPSQMKKLKIEYVEVIKIDYCPNPVNLFNKMEDEGIIQRKGNHFSTNLSEQELAEEIKRLADGYSLPVIMNIKIQPNNPLALE